MKYVYSGPDSGITLNTGSKDKPQWQDVLLRSGGTVDLPEKHEAVQTLQAQGYLEPVADAAALASVKPTAAKE